MSEAAETAAALREWAESYGLDIGPINQELLYRAASLLDRLAEVERKSEIDQRQTDDITAEAGKLADRLAAAEEVCERVGLLESKVASLRGWEPLWAALAAWEALRDG